MEQYDPASTQQHDSYQGTESMVEDHSAVQGGPIRGITVGIVNGEIDKGQSLWPPSTTAQTPDALTSSELSKSQQLTKAMNHMYY
jgi:hypothetical protein